MRTNLLLILLAVVTAIAAVEAYLLLNPDTSSIVGAPGTECINITRYNLTDGVDDDGGLNIPIQTKDDLIKQHKDNTANDPNAFQFCLISKKAIDAIFRHDPKANAIMCEMAVAKNDEDRGRNTMIFSGTRSPHFNIVDNIPDGKNFYATRFCPLKCQ